ncbi:hypothetical protein BKA70DRAFT_1535766 [Coprinopsis sp. MPI-PUGE-AT-0042]|nr:hypothetical protein BKA70DRAFT_1535766 [Coprinopsis sp. MPI-PUGE-AT-0042]
MAWTVEEKVRSIERLDGATQYATVILMAFLLGAQGFMGIYNLSVFCGMPKEQRKGRLRLILVSCLLLVASCISQPLEFWKSFYSIADRRIEGAQTLQALATSGGIAEALHFMTIAIGDSLTLWRCFVLWGDRKWVLILPSLTCVSSIVFSIVTFSMEIGGLDLKGLTLGQAMLVFVSLSVATNIMVTSLILFRLATTRRNMSKTFPDRKPPSMYSHVSAILVESAAPLAIAGVCFVIARAHALSPQMIIFRVTMGRSWKQVGGTDWATPTPSLRPIRFAHDEVESVDGETESSASV